MVSARTMWEWVSGWASRRAEHYIFTPIPANKTDLSEADLVRLEPYASYFRIWLSEMFLSNRVQWGKQQFPAVHSEIRLDFGKQHASFSRVVQPPTDKISEGVRLNYHLTELLPYNGGIVELEAALLQIKGADYLGTAIGVLKQFSSLVAPPLGQALTLAQTVATGTRDLLSAADGDVHLGFHQEWVSEVGSAEAGSAKAEVLRPGYVAVILAQPSQLDVAGLSVQNGQLHHTAPGAKKATHLTGYDYMLLRIEGRQTRDDWRLANIQEPLDQAIEALGEIPVNETKASAYLTVALAAAWRSPDLARHDRRRVVEAIKAEFAEIAKSGYGAVGTDLRDLDGIMRSRAMPVGKAQALGELTAEEVFG